MGREDISSITTGNSGGLGVLNHRKMDGDEIACPALKFIC